MREPRPLRTFALAVACLCVQRVSVGPDTAQIPLTPILVVVWCAVAMIRGQLGPSVPRLAVMCAFVASGVIGVWVYPTASAASFALVLVIFLPAVFTRTAGERASRSALTDRRAFADGVVLATAVAGIVGLAQSISTFVGLPYIDPIAQLVPSSLQLSGFNSSYAVNFGGSWIKANGMIFLEPSFLSLFSGLALVLVAGGAVRFRPRMTLLVVLGCVFGLLASVAISGLVLLPALIVCIFRSTRVAIGALAITVPLFFALASTPLVEVFLVRASGGNGSNDARLIRPYTELLPVFASGEPLFGYGAGYAHALAGSITQQSWSDEVTTPTLVKLLIEYGVIGAAALLTVCAFAFAVPGMGIGVKVGLASALFIPTDGLTNSVLASVVLLTLLASRNAPASSSVSSPTTERSRRSTRRSSTARLAS